MKTFVVLAGLMVIVPQTDELGRWTGLKVMVLDAASAGEPLGEKHHYHVTTVDNLNGTFGVPLEGAWTIKSESKRPMEIFGDERYLVLQRVYRDQPIGHVRPECYGKRFATECTSDKYRYPVKAVLTFEGGWRIRPVEVTHDREPRAKPTHYDDSVWGFVRVPEDTIMVSTTPVKTLHLPRAAPDEVELSAGLILDTLDDSEVSFRGPQDIGKLATLPPYVCDLFADYPERCAVVRFLNTMHAMSYEMGDQVEIDFTQDMMYELFDVDFDKQEIPRYLTFLRKDASPRIKEILFPGGGGTPFPRPCPPPTFAPYVEVKK